MLHVVASGYELHLDSQVGVRPAAAFGDTVTASGSANTKGNYTQIFSGAEVTDDVYGLLVNFNSGAVSTGFRNWLLDIGIDPAGGSTYTALVPNLYVGSPAPLTVGSGGAWYYFPLFMAAGSSVGIRGQCSTGSSSVRAWMKLYCRPRRPHQVRVGTRVTAYGIDAANSRGTTLTPGTTSDGAFVSLGTPAEGNWFWQYGWGAADTTMTANLLYFFDYAYGDASNKIILSQGIPGWSHSTLEQLSSMPLPTVLGATQELAANVQIFARCQCSGTSDSTISTAAYGMGG